MQLLKVFDGIDYIKDQTAEPNILEQEVAKAIVENKDIEYPIHEKHIQKQKKYTAKHIKWFKQSKKLLKKKNRNTVTFCKLQLSTILTTLRPKTIW